MSIFSMFSGHCSCCEASKKRSERLEDKLFAEIDSNRLRESELTNACLEAAQVTGRAGVHRPLRPHAPELEKEVEKDEVLISDSEIEEIAAQFIKDAELNGLKYTEDARVLLIESIRKEPLNYIR